MKMKHLFFGVLLFVNFIGFSQNNPKEVLFTIDGKPYYTDEFSRVYNKNLDLVKDESQKDLNQYLELFIGYKLKINKAYKLGLQKGEQYQNELKSYRDQLSKNYTTDSKVTKELVQEAYNRYLKEIKASHILIMIDENAPAEDTLSAYKKILMIRQRAIAGEDFGKLALEFSQDPSAKENKGDLGYFSAFRMVYPFETAAYSTPKGGVSMPVRTRFGYHLIKVEAIRDNRGEVEVAHIMILNPAKQADKAESNKTDSDKGRTTIQEIYKKIQQGENFEDLAKQFSEDKSSSAKGGLLNRFGSGQLSSEEFEQVAFSLTNENPISAPFQSQFGWHIVKFIKNFPIKTLEQMQQELETKVSKDDRSRLITASMTEKLRKKYSVKRDPKCYAEVSKLVTDDFYNAKWELPADLKPYEKQLFTINNDKNIPASSFLTFVNAQQKIPNIVKPVSKLVENLYGKYVDEQINTYYNDNLEKEFPEFAAVMEEYRDGLLLFDLMEKEIWTKSKTDTIGLQKFYDLNSKNYQWKNRLEVIIASSTHLDAIKKAYKFLKRGKTPEFIKEQLNIKDGPINIMTNSGTFEEGNEVLPKNIIFEKGVSDVFKEGDYYFATNVKKVIPAGPKTLDECKGKVINDYQQFLEENWVKDLKGEFKVEVDQAVFEKVKKQLHP